MPSFYKNIETLINKKVRGKDVKIEKLLLKEHIQYIKNVFKQGRKYAIGKIVRMVEKIEERTLPGFKDRFMEHGKASMLGCVAGGLGSWIEGDEIKPASVIAGVSVGLAMDIARFKVRQRELNKISISELCKNTAVKYQEYKESKNLDEKQKNMQILKENIATGKVNPELVKKELDGRFKQSWTFTYNAWKKEQDKIRSYIKNKNKEKESSLFNIKEDVKNNYRKLFGKKPKEIEL